MKDLLKQLDAKLLSLNTHFVAFLGAVLFVPALTLLDQPDMAAAVISQVFPHFSPIEAKFASTILIALAGNLLYLGRPHTVKDDQNVQ